MFDGRGRWMRLDAKEATDDYQRLRAHWIATHYNRAGTYAIQWSRVGDGAPRGSITITVIPDHGVTLRYTIRGESVPESFVRWETTAPHFGGLRYWWLCPSCGRRCADLYGGRYFLCRKCHDLTYRTAQCGNLSESIGNRMWAIRKRLKAKGWLTDPLPGKPNYMHWRTYFRLVQEYRYLANLHACAVFGGIAPALGVAMPSAGLVKTAWRANCDPSPLDEVEWQLLAAFQR